MTVYDSSAIASTGNPIIDMQGVELTFGNDAGVYDINITVPRGTIFGMIGPSGSGKTTTVRLMTGLYRPTKGQIRVLGQVPARFSVSARERIGYMPQQFVLYPNLTVRENLNFVASLYGMSYFRRRKRLNEMLDFVELRNATRRLGSQLSGGMKRRLELACSLVHDPALLFADEPTAGIDPVLRGKFWDQFRELRDRGRTLFVTTQYVGEAAYCDYVGVMRNGRLLFVDTPEGLRRRALGGEVVQMTVDPQHMRQVIGIVQGHPLVDRVERVRGAPNLVRFYVEDASTALPVIVNLFDDYPQIKLQMEPFVPSLDEVFISLMEEVDRQEAAAAAAKEPANG